MGLASVGLSAGCFIAEYALYRLAAVCCPPREFGRSRRFLRIGLFLEI